MHSGAKVFISWLIFSIYTHTFLTDVIVIEEGQKTKEILTSPPGFNMNINNEIMHISVPVDAWGVFKKEQMIVV